MAGTWYRLQAVMSPAHVLIACVAAALSAACATTPRAIPPAVVVGSIVDSTGIAPLPGARISVVGTDVAATAAQDGRFLLVGIPSGPQRIFITLAEHDTVQLPALRVASGDTLRLHAMLMRADRARLVPVFPDRPDPFGAFPMLILDGVIQMPPHDSSRWNTWRADLRLDTLRIVSIDIMSGEKSASVYGRRGAANGIVNIRTRR